MNDLELIKKTFENQIHKTVKSIHQFENVPNNSVFKVETEYQSYIFKVYSKRDWPEDGKIPFVYRKLTEYHIPHAVLFVFNRDNQAFQNGYLIEEMLPGTTADRLTLSENDTVALFEKLAALVSRVHRITLTNYGYIGRGEPAIWTTFSEYMYDTLNDNAESLVSNGFVTAEELREINRAIYARLKRCDIFPAILCHGDLSTKNILVYDNEITLIDWDDAQAICWAADIARLTFWMKLHYDERAAAACREAFMRHYETEHDKNVFVEMEDTLHVWYGLDNLTFFTEGALCERAKNLLRDARNKCGI